LLLPGKGCLTDWVPLPDEIGIADTLYGAE
jgi:hypothetical protein